ncbi:DUF4244 domain-containing protein [Gephyromycinifex aptenodytis]|uniref:DUF4244 domain-containing protein n=1 Tax=Gephyromycinifex aptenodytis TaxID=2716227 RepID=UPI001445631F|nr:DUF4244 domain-containing protein [Gephyromycinifex aptenodytis]
MSMSTVRRNRFARHLHARLVQLRAAGESGMTTAEYAVGTVAAVSFAAVLITVVKSGAVAAALTKIISTALTVG